MDIEVMIKWDGSPDSKWVPTEMQEEVHSVRKSLENLLKTNDTVTLREDGIGCTLIYRKVVD